MKIRNSDTQLGLVPLALLLLPIAGGTQVPVDDDGNAIGAIGAVANSSYETYSPEPATGNEDIPLLSSTDLEELVGPIALYPDDLLAVVLPAATYPLQVVQAARFLDDLESNPELKPNPDWDDSIIALINYPEVVALLNEDLDWTWRLGEAVVAQQPDVLGAVEQFRNRAYAAGNLKSDNYQTVLQDEGIIEITPVNEEIIYVPYYEPARVVHYQSRPAYYYYPEPCPVYYYPYPTNYDFHRRNFWGVTTAFTIGWTSSHLRVFHHSYYGHPYFGIPYWDRWWYRRPSISLHNNVYINNNLRATTSRYGRGDHWQPSRNTRLRYTDQRISRSVYNPNRRSGTGIGSANRTINRTTTSTTSRHSFAPAQRDRAVQPRDRVPQARDRLVQPRDRVPQARDRIVQPRDNAARSRQHQPARQSEQRHRVAVIEQRREDSVRRSNRQPSASAERRVQPSATTARREQATRNTGRRDQATRNTTRREQAPQTTERRQQAAPSSERRSQKAAESGRKEHKVARRSSSDRDSRRRR